MLQPSLSKVEDSFVWQPLQSGVYTTRSGYFSATMQTATNPNSSEPVAFSWVKDVWSEVCSPKMKLFLWSIIQRALPLGENLQHRGMVSGSLCKRCNVCKYLPCRDNSNKACRIRNVCICPVLNHFADFAFSRQLLSRQLLLGSFTPIDCRRRIVYH
ncbi:hypothetical protein YC2023_032913 [Brassica napus]